MGLAIVSITRSQADQGRHLMFFGQNALSHASLSLSLFLSHLALSLYSIIHSRFRLFLSVGAGVFGLFNLAHHRCAGYTR